MTLSEMIDRIFRVMDRKKLDLCPKAILLLYMTRDCQEMADAQKELKDHHGSLFIPERESLSLSSAHDKKMLQLINDWIRD